MTALIFKWIFQRLPVLKLLMLLYDNDLEEWYLHLLLFFIYFLLPNRNLPYSPIISISSSGHFHHGIIIVAILIHSLQLYPFLVMVVKFIYFCPSNFPIYSYITLHLPGASLTLFVSGLLSLIILPVNPLFLLFSCIILFFLLPLLRLFIIIYPIHLHNLIHLFHLIIGVVLFFPLVCIIISLPWTDLPPIIPLLLLLLLLFIKPCFFFSLRFGFLFHLPIFNIFLPPFIFLRIYQYFLLLLPFIVLSCLWI